MSHLKVGFFGCRDDWHNPDLSAEGTTFHKFHANHMLEWANFMEALYKEMWDTRNYLSASPRPTIEIPDLIACAERAIEWKPEPAAEPNTAPPKTIPAKRRKAPVGLFSFEKYPTFNYPICRVMRTMTMTTWTRHRGRRKEQIGRLVPGSS